LWGLCIPAPSVCFVSRKATTFINLIIFMIEPQDLLLLLQLLVVGVDHA
jgi:hypothetical protein